MHRKRSPFAQVAQAWPPLAVLLCGALLITACGTTDDSADAGGKKTNDAGAVDVPLAFEVTVTKADPYACPGGYGCDCAADADCNAGVCLDGPSGKSCSIPCGQGCPAGLACATLEIAGATIHHCVPAHVDLCDPCTKTDACTSLGRPDSACVSYGAAGNFCGSACDGDADCPAGYACETAQHADGGSSLQCVKKPEKGGAPGVYGECACSATAVAGKLGTACWVQKDGARCYGGRGCSSAGLSACSAEAPAAEACDGVDNDCNGLTDEDTCNDNNACTTDACKDGKCAFTNVASACNADSSVCTANDACKGGKCEPGAAIKCDDGNPCTKDSCDPAKGCQHKGEDALPCDADGSKCTKDDACLDGVCTAGDAVVCDDKNPCTVDSCNPADAKCTNTGVVGLSCDDGKFCTQTDLCDKDGKCAGSQRACNDGNACTSDSCDDASQKCAFIPQNGATCDDGNKCTTADKCEGNVCKSGAAKECKATGACMVAYCNGLTGDCVNLAAKEGFGCDDGKKCTVNDTCDAGGKCQAGTPMVCGDGPACATGSCNETSGKCEAGQAKDGTDCDDGDPCTEGSKCTSGKCGDGKAKVCNDNKPCTIDSCETGKGCAYKDAANGTVCDDGNACNLAKCASGSCLKAKDICACTKDGDCDDENPCTSGKCNTNKCAYTNKTAGDACDDGNKCTANDKCGDVGGKLVCKGPDATDCDDKEACTTDSCDPLAGCQYETAAEDSDCDDGSKCTSATRCKSGKCTGTTKQCTDNGKACTPNQCDPADGTCKESNAKDGTTCNDGNKCTEDDACKTGKCEGAPLASKVITLAGNGSPAYKDGKGAAAQFNGPTGVAVDAAGNVYVSEGAVPNFYRIRKVAADGTVTTWAGSGIAGDTNASGTQASFRAPRGLAMIGEDLYVADTGNGTIRKVDKDRKVTLVAGKTASANHSGSLSVPLYFGVKTDKKTTDGKGAAAEFNVPMALAAVGTGGAAYLAVAETDGHVIRKVLLDGTVSTIAGSGSKGTTDGKGAGATFDFPVGVAADGDVIYVADNGGNKVRKVAADGTVTTVAGGGSAGFKDDTGAAALFKNPFGLAVDVKKTLLVADWQNNRVRAVATADGKTTTYAGTGESALFDGALNAAKFKGMWGIAADGKGNTYVVSPFGHALRVIQDPFKACVP